MSDAVRAEARRRRILLNSQNRLQKITGRIEDPLPGNGLSSDISETQANISRDFPDDSALFSDIDSRLLSHDVTPNIFEYPEAVPETESAAECQDDISKRYILGNPKLRVVVLAFVVHIISMLSDTSISNYFFLPLFILEITDIIFGQPINKNSLFSTVLALGGISPRKSTWIVKIISGVRKFFEDACLYLFVFVILHTLEKMSV